MVNLITDHIDVWTSAQTQKTNGAGRGNHSANHSLHGIKKLRELILELAVRGKLVPQDPKDESASVLLEKITKEKARLIKEGKLKKQEPLQEINNVEKPFELPETWEWIRLGSAGIGSTGKTPSTSNPKYYNGVIPFIGPGQISPEGNITEPDKTLTIEGCEYSTIAEPGDILMVCIGGSIGKSVIVRSSVAFNQQINNIRPLIVDSVFLNITMKAPHFQTAILNAATGSATPIINRSKWEDLLVALPPLYEQCRIVAKVDDLMAICDKLEQQQTDSNAAHQTLVETLLATLTSTTDQDEFIEAWQRIASHFDILFTTEQSIDQLKQTILQLAVMGKLVPQNPNDEPASVLLENIAKEKARLIKEGKIKKEKPLPEISEDEKPFNLPIAWEWVRFENITYQITDGTHHTPIYVTDGVPFLSVKDMSAGYLDFSKTRYITQEQHEGLIKRCNPKRGDLLLTKVGTTGIPILIETDKPFSIFVSVALIKFAKDQMSGRFLELLIKSPFVKVQSEEGTEGIGNKNLVLRKISAFSIIVPPLAEQHRIVAKVDELMALCDKIKTRLQDAQTTQIHLADAIVEQAVG